MIKKLKVPVWIELFATLEDGDYASKISWRLKKSYNHCNAILSEAYNAGLITKKKNNREAIVSLTKKGLLVKHACIGLIENMRGN